jgi:hypothetical protein
MLLLQDQCTDSGCSGSEEHSSRQRAPAAPAPACLLRLHKPLKTGQRWLLTVTSTEEQVGCLIDPRRLQQNVIYLQLWQHPPTGVAQDTTQCLTSY